MAKLPLYPKTRVRFRRYGGKWYAHATGPKKERNLALWVAIAFCRRMNAKTTGGPEHG
jgi:hypothetical protein